jgi:hypothetical protein
MDGLNRKRYIRNAIWIESTISETKFVGLLFDSKLTFLPHIKMLKNKSLKALNILKFVSSTDWGADSTVLLNYIDILHCPFFYLI